jgi:hypothetical protein
LIASAEKAQMSVPRSPGTVETIHDRRALPIKTSSKARQLLRSRRELSTCKRKLWRWDDKWRFGRNTAATNFTEIDFYFNFFEYLKEFILVVHGLNQNVI